MGTESLGSTSGGVSTHAAQVCAAETGTEGPIPLIDSAATLTYDLRDPNHITIHVINLVTGNFLAGGKT